MSLIPRVNALLARVGISRSFSSAEELSTNASSFLVAAFESVFSTSIVGVERHPRGESDYASNAQRAIDALAAVLPPRVDIPPSVTGAAVAAGDLPAVAFLVSLLDDASRVMAAGAAGTLPASAAASAAAAAATASTSPTRAPPDAASSAAWLASSARSGVDASFSGAEDARTADGADGTTSRAAVVAALLGSSTASAARRSAAAPPPPPSSSSSYAPAASSRPMAASPPPVPPTPRSPRSAAGMGAR
jgi:hypothetical protein